MSSDSDRIHTCAFCSSRLSEDDAIEEGWIPDFCIGNTFIDQAMCVECQQLYLHLPHSEEAVPFPQCPDPLTVVVFRYNFLTPDGKERTLRFVKQPDEEWISEHHTTNHHITHWMEVVSGHVLRDV